jgi:hypothetical protein
LKIVKRAGQVLNCDFPGHSLCFVTDKGLHPYPN